MDKEHTARVVASAWRTVIRDAARVGVEGNVPKIAEGASAVLGEDRAKGGGRIVVAFIAATMIATVAATYFAGVRIGGSFAVVVFFAGSLVSLSEYALGDLVSSHGWRIGRLGAAASICALVAIAAVCGVVGEALTLSGSSLASLLNPGDWRGPRIAAIAMISFVLVTLFLWFRKGHPRSTVPEELAGFFGGSSIPARIAVVATWVVAASSAVACWAVGGLSLSSALLFSLAIALVVDVFILVGSQVGDHPEYALIVSILAFGCYLVFALPAETNISPDDQIHYESAKGLSFLAGAEVNGAEESLYHPETMPTVDVGRPNIGEDTDVTGIHLDQDDIDAYQLKIDEVAQTAPVRYAGFEYWNITCASFGYVPSAIGLWLGRLFHLPLTVMLRIGKLFNLFFYAVICFYAVRALPVRKVLASVIALVPGLLFLAANYTYDSWVFALILLALGLFLREVCDRDTKLEKRTAVAIILCFVLALGPKAVYFPLMGVLLLMPKSKFANRRAHATYVAAACLAALFVLASFAAPFLMASGSAATDARGGVDVDAGLQLQGVIADPVGSALMLVNYLFTVTLPNSLPTGLVVYGYIGGTVSWLPSTLHIAPALLVIAALTDWPEKSFIRIGGRLWVLFDVFCALFLAALALYLAYTPVGADGIAGLQGRYLFPLIFPLLAFCVPAVKLPRVPKSAYTIAFFSAALLLVAVSDVFMVVSRIAA